MNPSSQLKNIKTYPKRKGRKIVVDGVEWKWKVGISNVIAYSERGEVKKESPWMIVSLSADTFVRGQWKKITDGAICPKKISKWLGEGKVVAKGERVLGQSIKIPL